MIKFLNFHKLALSLKEDISPSLMKTFGIFGLINFPLLYLLGASLLGEKVSAFYLRAIGFIACLLLALVDCWPLKFNRYRTLYWFIAITYCLPFFATYMFIANEGSIAWQVKITVAMFWLILVTNWLQTLVILFLGITLAFFAFTVFSGAISIGINNMWGDILNYIWAIVIASIFARRQEIIQQEKLASLRTLAGAVAHEMRTPLFLISTISYRLKKYLPLLVKSYNLVKDDKENQNLIEPHQLKAIKEIPQNIERINRSAFTFIDMLLMNLKENFKYTPTTVYSVQQCIEEALKNYPFLKGERSIVMHTADVNFKFKGNDLFVQHIMFNLLKNSLYYIKAANKGKITIIPRIEKDYNKLYFKDTGAGIPAHILPYIFDKFYSQTKYGTGIGLTFCKMVMKNLGGDIICHSKEGEFTEFILSFPIIKSF